jgi:hypothetical protein
VGLCPRPRTHYLVLPIHRHLHVNWRSRAGKKKTKKNK